MPLAHILAPQLARKAEEIAAATGHPSPSYLAQAGVTGGATPYGNVHDTAQAVLDPNAAKAYLTGVNQTLDTRAIDGIGPTEANPWAGPYIAGQAALGDIGSKGADSFFGGFDQGVDAGHAALLEQDRQRLGLPSQDPAPSRPSAYLNIDNRPPLAPMFRNVDASKLRAGKGDLAKALKRGALSYNPNDITVPDALMLNSMARNTPVGDIEGVRRFFGGPVGGPFYNGYVQGAATSDRVATGQVNPDAMARGEMQPGALDLSKPLIVDPKAVAAAEAKLPKKGDKKKLPAKIIIPGNMAYLNQAPNVRTLERGNADVHADDTDPFAQKILGYPNDPTVY